MSVLLSGFATLFELIGHEWVSFGENGTFTIMSEDTDGQIEPLTITFINPTRNVRYKQRAEKVDISDGALIMKVADDTNKKVLLSVRFVIPDHVHEAMSIYIQRAQARSTAVEAHAATLPEWPCSLCTFINEGKRDSCAMCLTARSDKSSAQRPRPSPVSIAIEPGQMGQRRFSGDQTPVRRLPGAIASSPFDLYSTTSSETAAVESLRKNGGVPAAFAPGASILYSHPDSFAPNEDLVQQSMMRGLARQVSLDHTIEQSTSRVDFEMVASHIASGRTFHLGIFKTLRGVVANLRQEDQVYRELYASNKKVRERFIEPEGVVDFLALLGFESDEGGTKLVCHEMPNELLVNDALDVLDTYLKNRPQRIIPRIQDEPGLSSVAMLSDEKEADANHDPAVPDDQNDDEFTLEQIVLWVTQPSEKDTENEDVLLLCYFTIATPEFLISVLRDRYFSIPIPPNLTKDERTDFIQKQQQPVQYKVTNLIRNWIKSYWREDFRNSQSARDAMYNLLDDFGRGTDTFRRGLAESIRQLIHQCVDDDANLAMDDGEIALPRSLSARLSEVELPDPEPATPRSLIARSFSRSVAGAPPAKLSETVASFDDIANQITLMDFYVFAAIRPRECLGQAWKKENREELAPNVLKIIAQFNDFVKWVQVEIISEKNVRDRGRKIKRIIKMGQRLLNLRNYNALYALYSALNASVIVRLEKAWERVPTKQMRVFEELKVIFNANKNQMNLRTLLRQAPAPSIPHVGIFLQDLVFIDDGNKTRMNMFLREDADAASVFNFDKARRLTERIKTITRYQHQPYDLEEDLVMQKQLYEEMKLVRNINEEVMWEMSSAVKRSDAA